MFEHGSVYFGLFGDGWEIYWIKSKINEDVNLIILLNTQ